MEDSLISISEILRSFKKRLWIIILITLITTIFGFSRTRGLVPSYSGYMKVLISSGSSSILKLLSLAPKGVNLSSSLK